MCAQLQQWLQQLGLLTQHRHATDALLLMLHPSRHMLTLSLPKFCFQLTLNALVLHIPSPWYGHALLWALHLLLFSLLNSRDFFF